MNWISYGDRNTSFFSHKVAKYSHASKQMTILKHGESVLVDPLDIEQHVISFYKNLFASSNSCLDNALIDKVIPDLVSREDNCILTNIPTMDEVRKAVFAMDGESVPGPDGFGGAFYHAFWDVIDVDVFNSTLQIFLNDWILDNLNSSIVVLIPKFVGDDKIENFRPIALANFQFKTITKVIAERLEVIAPKIIFENQRGFARERYISYYICIAFEAINMLDHRLFGGNLDMKFDIKKAFDTVDWLFLLKLLSAYGFDAKF